MTRGEYIYKRRKYQLELIEKSKIKFDIQKLKTVWQELGYFYFKLETKKEFERLTTSRKGRR